MTAEPLAPARYHPLRGPADAVGGLQVAGWTGGVLVAVLRGLRVESIALDTVGYLVTLTGLLSVVFLLVWFYRARRNLDVIPGARPRWSPRWTIGVWFIPIANVVLIPLVWLELIRDSAGDLAPRMRWLVAANLTLMLIEWIPLPAGAEVLTALIHGLRVATLLALVFGLTDAQDRLLT